MYSRDTPLTAKLQRVRLLVSDVDGTLTDGSLYYSVNGEELKRFHVHDGLGLQLLQRANIAVALLSQERSAIVQTRARKLGIALCVTGALDKAEAVRQMAQQLHIPLDDVAYIGDDLTDLPAMRLVGVSACPADAVTEVQQAVDYVCRRPGGNGAVREFCELILRARAIELESICMHPDQQVQQVFADL